MPYSATVFNVLIASPSDVEEEREAIAQTIHDWNSLNSAETGKVLLPVRWESHCAPAMGDRPQGIINEQVVRGCDILIGAFWMRLGSPTGIEDSGTVEEIKLFLKQNKPVMLYYSKKPIVMDEADLVQVQKLKDFKKTICNEGIQEQYCNTDELKQKLMRQLTILMRGISIDTHVTENVMKEAKAAKIDKTALSKNDQTLLDDDNIVRLINYTDKAFVVIGNTLEYKYDLQAENGKWTKLRFGKNGWMFSKKRIKNVAKIFGIAPELSEYQS